MINRILNNKPIHHTARARNVQNNSMSHNEHLKANLNLLILATEKQPIIVNPRAEDLVRLLKTFNIPSGHSLTNELWQISDATNNPNNLGKYESLLEKAEETGNKFVQALAYIRLSDIGTREDKAAALRFLKNNFANNSKESRLIQQFATNHSDAINFTKSKFI